MGQPINLYANQQGIQIVLPATQGENLAREYDFTIIGLDNQPIDLTGTTVIMYVLKENNVVQIPSVISGNVATIILPYGACDVAGIHKCFIQVIKPGEFDLRIDNMVLSIIPCNVDNAGEASSEFTELTQLIANAQQAIENANDAADEARTTAESVATQTAETVSGNIINQQKAQPNGLATLNSEGALEQTNGLVTSVNGQTGDILNIAATDENGYLITSQIPPVSTFETVKTDNMIVNALQDQDLHSIQFYNCSYGGLHIQLETGSQSASSNTIFGLQDITNNTYPFQYLYNDLSFRIGVPLYENDERLLHNLKTLWSGSITTGQTATMSEPLTNFSLIFIVIDFVTGGKMSFLLKPTTGSSGSLILNGSIYNYFGNPAGVSGAYLALTGTIDTLTVVQSEGRAYYLNLVYGLR